MGKVPRWNLIVSLYPVGALLWAWMQSGNFFFAWLYGIGNLGYLLLALAIHPGTFQLMGLRNRKQVFAIALVALLNSVVFTWLTFG